MDIKITTDTPAIPSVLYTDTPNELCHPEISEKIVIHIIYHKLLIESIYSIYRYYEGATISP